MAISKKAVKASKAVKTSKKASKAVATAIHVVSPETSARQELAAFKAHFNMTSPGGCNYVAGQSPMYAKYFVRDNPAKGKKAHVIFSRPFAKFSPAKLLNAIRSANSN